MRNNSFKKELGYGLVFVLCALLCGFLTNYWSLSLLVWALIYIFWKWLELFHFYKWYKTGASEATIGLNKGVWFEFANLVLATKSKYKKVEKKNQYLINQFDTMAQAMPYATVLLNKRFETIWMNDSSNHILNINNSKDCGIKIDTVITEPLFVQLLTKDLDDKEVKIQHPIDHLKRIVIRIVKLSNKRYLMVARDISEQDALRVSRKAFIDNASHELRTPLTVITGYLEMLQTAEDIPSSWQQGISQAKLQSKRMEKIINDMLKLSVIEHEHFMESENEIIDMPKLLNRLFNDVKSSSIAKDHSFTANIDSSLLIKGNEDEIISICLNLLNNAVIHTQVGTSVSVKWFRENNKALLRICDDGAGIDDKHLPHLSERFYRVDNSGDKNTNSTGLGLAIVKQICDNHKAHLEIESEKGKATCFQVTFQNF